MYIALQKSLDNIYIFADHTTVNNFCIWNQSRLSVRDLYIFSNWMYVSIISRKYSLLHLFEFTVLYCNLELILFYSFLLSLNSYHVTTRIPEGGWWAQASRLWGFLPNINLSDRHLGISFCFCKVSLLGSAYWAWAIW